jgi:hypothetical protein
MLLLATACASPTNRNASNKDVMMREAQAVSAQIGVTFPANAVVEHVERIEGRDNAARATLLLSQEEWEALRGNLMSTSGVRLPFSSDANFHLGPDEGEWTPAKAQGLSVVQIPWRDGTEALNLGYAPADSGRVRVFLFWHQL